MGFSTAIYVANENAMLAPDMTKAPVEMIIVCAMQNERGMLKGSMRYIIPWATLVSSAVAIQITKIFTEAEGALEQRVPDGICHRPPLYIDCAPKCPEYDAAGQPPCRACRFEFDIQH